MSEKSAQTPEREGLTVHAPFSRLELLFLVGVTLLAAALRLYKLGEWSFWVDEAHTFRDITAPAGEFWESGTSRYPLGYMLLRSLLETNLLPSNGEGWLRLPFAFLGILSIPTLAIFGRGIVGKRAALLGALLLSVSHWHLYWSQNARAYSLAMLLGMLGCFGVYDAIVRRSVRWTLASLLLIVASGLAHPSGFALFLAVAAFLLLELRSDAELRRQLLRPWVIGVFVVIIALAAMWAWPALSLAREKKGDFSAIHLAQTFAWFLGPPMIVAVLGGLIGMVRRAELRQAAFLGAWICAPMVALVVLGVWFTKVTAQYGLIILPAVCLTTGWLLVAVRDGLRIWGRFSAIIRWAPAFMVLADLVAYDALYFMRQHGDRPRWREAAQEIRVESDGPVTVVTTNDQSMKFYLDRGSFWGEPREEVEIAGITRWAIENQGGGEGYFEHFVQHCQLEDRELWVVVTEPELNEFDRGGQFERVLRRRSQQVARFKSWSGPKDMSVFVYRVPAEPR